MDLFCHFTGKFSDIGAVIDGHAADVNGNPSTGPEVPGCRAHVVCISHRLAVRNDLRSGRKIDDFSAAVIDCRCAALPVGRAIVQVRDIQSKVAAAVFRHPVRDIDRDGIDSADNAIDGCFDSFQNAIADSL